MGFKVRLADSRDGHDVSEALLPQRIHLQAAFGLLDFHRIIELSLFSFVALDDGNKVVAFASFNDESSIPGTVAMRKTDKAKAWARQEASDLGFLADSLLWLEVCGTTLDPEETLSVSEMFMRSIFMICPDLQAVLHPCPAQHPVFPHLLKFMSVSSEFNLHMCACLRSTVLPVMRIRRAEEEDYDNLLPLIKRAQKWGSPLAQVPERACPSKPYATARLIAAQDENNVVLVAEVDDKLVGLMAVTATISNDYCYNFVLDDFYGLTTKVVKTFEIPLEDDSSSEASLEPSPEVSPKGEDPAEGTVQEQVAAGADSQPPNTTPETNPVEVDESQGVLEPEAAAEEETPEAPKVRVVEVEVPSEVTNAFQILMFCMDEAFEHQAIDFLYAAFEVEQRDYCLLGYPYVSRTFPLLQLFTRVTSRPSRKITRMDLPFSYMISDTPPDRKVSGLCLYLMHRDSLYPGFEVRPTKSRDVDELMDFLEPFADRHNIIDLIEQPRKGCSTMVAVLSAQIVGFAMIEDNVPVRALATHFNVQSIVNLQHHPAENQACVTFFTLGPIFRHRRRLFLREIMRQLGKTTLYCPIFPDQELPDVIEDFLLASPRQHANLSAAALWGREMETIGPSKRASLRRASGLFSARGLFQGFNCALYVTTHRLCCRHRVVVNSRILVAGASRTAEAFLEKLISSTRMQFTNLSLVSPSGFSGFSSPAASILNVASGPAREFSKLGIDCQVALRVGAVTGFDREGRTVLLSNDEVVPYDLLILVTGLQDQTKSRLRLQEVEAALRADDFLLELSTNVLKQFEKLRLPREAFLEGDGFVVVYGSTLEAFYTIQLLLLRGVKSCNIILAYPELQLPPGLLHGDANMLYGLMEELSRKQVNMAPGMKLVGVTLNDAGNLKGVLFERTSAEEEEDDVKQPCCLLVTCDRKQVDVPLFDSLRRENITFDGRIVIDGNFQTNDEFVFSAGTASKFSRRCGKLPKLETFCSHEIGEALACSIMAKFNAHYPEAGKLWPSSFTLTQDLKKQTTRSAWLTPILGRPKCTGGILPVGIQHFCIILPTCQDKDWNSLNVHSLLTKNDKLYARLDISETKQVARFLYAGRAFTDAWKFQQLVGLPVSLLNNLPRRYCEGDVDDIVGFLLQSWSAALFHDKFIPFYTGLSLEVIQASKKHPKGSQIAFTTFETMDVELASEIATLVNKALIRFIESLKAELPMYRIPWKKVDLKLLLPVVIKEQDVEAQEIHKKIASAAAGPASAALRAVTDMVLGILARVTTQCEREFAKCEQDSLIRETVETLIQEMEKLQPVLLSIEGGEQMDREIEKRMLYIRVWDHLKPPDLSFVDREIKVAVQEMVNFLEQVSVSQELLPLQEEDEGTS